MATPTRGWKIQRQTTAAATVDVMYGRKYVARYAVRPQILALSNWANRTARNKPSGTVMPANHTVLVRLWVNSGVLRSLT